MNGYQFTRDEVSFLTTSAGRAALACAADLPLLSHTMLADLQTLRKEFGDTAAAIAEITRLRRRASQQWHLDDESPIARWLFTAEALQQASPPQVAAHRAHRIGEYVSAERRGGVHDVTCSIGADLAVFARSIPGCVGSDIDDVRLAMATHNIEASDVAADLFLADARTVTTRGLLRYADPARRTDSGRRITNADTIPTVAELDDADSHSLPVLRLPPGIDYTSLNRPGEIEIVSLAGSVREAVAWPPPLALVARRATVLSVTGTVEVITDSDPDTDAVTAAGRYLIDPDPAIVRAHLVTNYAARYGLTRLDPHLAYLTGDSIPPHVRGFRILDGAPYSEKTLRQWVRRDEVGTVEIKQRGTPVIPDQLRQRLKPAGDKRVARTIVIARLARATWAWWCEAIPAAATST